MSDENEKFDKEAFVAGIKAKYNGAADVALAVLGSENYELRNERRELREKQIPEGATVITGDDAKQFNNFKQFLTESKLDLKQIKDAVAKVPELEKQNKELAQAENYREAAAALGYKPNVLRKALSVDFPDAEVSLKDEKDSEGNVRKVPYIALDGKESSLESFVSEKGLENDYSLKVEATTAPPKPGNTGDPRPAGSDSIYDRIRASAKQHSELQPKPVSLREIAGRTN